MVFEDLFSHAVPVLVPTLHSLPCLEEKNEEGRGPKDSTPKWLFLSGPPFKIHVVLGLQAFLKIVSCVKLAGCASRCGLEQFAGWPAL